MKRLTYYGLQDDLYKCDICGFASHNDGHVIAHMQLEHDMEHTDAHYSVVVASIEDFPKSGRAGQWYFRRRAGGRKFQGKRS